MKALRFFLLFVVICVAPPMAVSQHLQNVTTSTREHDLSNEALTVLEANNSNLKRVVLDNGMICLVKQDSSAPVVSVQVWVRVGAINEDDMLGAGLSHALEHMIFKGTEEMSPGDVSRLINNAGGEINAYTSFDRTVFHADLPSENWEVGLTVIADAMKAPAFPEEEWKKERDVILREFAMGRDDHGRVLDKLLWRTAFVVHPYRFPIIGIEESFSEITRDDLVNFFKENYVADNMIAVVVGDVSNEEAMKKLRETFEDMPPTPRKTVVLPQEPRQMAPRVIREPGNWKLSRCEIAWHTVELSHPDAVALDLVAEIISNGRSSRFVKEIQEDKQLVHSIGCYSYTPIEPGIFGIYAEFDPAKEKDVLSAIEEQVALLLKDGYTDDEISRARRQVLASALSPLQTMKGQADSYASGEFYSANPFFTTAYLKNLSAITAEDLLRVTRKYLFPEGMSTAIIVPESAADQDEEQAKAKATTAPAKTDTESGITLITREDHRLPFVYFCVTLKDGFLSETEENSGITRFMTDLLLRGTKSMSSEQIAAEIESRGGTINTFSGVNSFGLRARCLTADAPRFMELLADCLENPSFTEEEVEKQRKMHLAAIKEAKERPIALAQEQLRKMMFPAHPYRFSPLGTEEAISSITPEMLREFHSKLLAKNRLVVSVFGDISTEQVTDMVDASLKDIPAVADGQTSAEPPQFSLPARTVITAPREQTIILVGYPALPVKDPRNDALILLDIAMSGLSSELAMEVREKRGLAYFVGAYQQMALQGGSFVLYAGIRAEVRDEVESLMAKEIERVTVKGISDEEFDRAKTQAIAHNDMIMQNNYNMAMKSALDELVGMGFDHSFKARERFGSLTKDAVRDAAAAILKSDRRATAIIIPEETEQGDKK